MTLTKADPNECTQIINFLASMPAGHSTTTRANVKKILLDTGGQLMSRGELFDIISKRIGPGVYRVSLKRFNP